MPTSRGAIPRAMNNVQIFQNSQFGQIRVATNETGEPLFCLADLCQALQLTNSRKVKSQLDDDVTLSYPIVDSLGREQQATFVTEAGMYTVILRSDSPKAKPMQKWVTSEVLPSIRKTGGYMTSRTDETPEEIMARAIKIAEETIKRKDERINALSIENELHKQELQLSAPKVQYFNEVLSSEGCITINKIALDLGMSAIKLNRILCEKHIQYREGETYLLYSKYRDKGYAVLRPHPYIDSLGRHQTRQHLYWTEKGKAWIRELLKAAN